MKRNTIRSLALVAMLAGVVVTADDAAAIDQTFGANFSGNWVLGTYFRNGTIAAAPYPAQYAGGAAVVSLSSGNPVNVARLVGVFVTGPCVRALGNAAGTTWGDTSCTVL